MAEKNDDLKLVCLYKAPDEVTAHLIKGLLDDAGIPVMLASRQVPWMDGVMIMLQGYWGDVLVPEDELDSAQAVIAPFISEQE